MNGELFGEPLTAAPAVEARPDGKPRRRPTAVQGYAARPGTGPAGETCKSCRHHCVIRYAKPYHKCSEFRRLGGKWTGGPGTDIRVGSPACSYWESGEPREWTAPR